MVTQTWPVKEERARLRAVSPTGMLMDFEKQKLFGLFTLPSTSTAREYSFVETVYLDIDSAYTDTSRCSSVFCAAHLSFGRCAGARFV